MNASFVVERQHDALRAAKLALLKIQARQRLKEARHVEEALAQVAQAITGEMVLPAISSSNCKRTGFTCRGAS